MPKIHSTTLLKKLHAVNLADRHGKSIREIAKIVDIPKSTVHDNLPYYRRELNAIAAEVPYNPTLQLVRSVLVNVFEGKSSSRDTATVLSRLHDTTISHQTVLAILDLGAKIADDLNKTIDLKNISSAGFDEVFFKSSPILGLADLDSAVIQIQQAFDRSSETWSSFLQGLKLLGLDPDYTVTDGGTGLLGAINIVFSGSTNIRDLFHVLNKISKALKSMEGKCYGLIKNFDVLTSKSKPDDDLSDHKRHLDLAIEIFDLFDQRQKDLRIACYFGNPDELYAYQSSAKVSDIIKACIAHLTRFIDEISNHTTIKQAKSYLENSIENIVAYKKEIEIKMESYFGPLNADTALRFLCPIVEYLDQYIRSHDSRERQSYWGGKIAELRAAFRRQSIVDQDEVDRAINEVSQILSKSKKSNSLMETVNSVIRQHLNTYKSVPRWFCPLFTFFWNHRRFTRGKRKGFAPVELLAGSTLNKDWLDMILENFPLDKIDSGLPYIA